MTQDAFRFLILTDNHLGYDEKDPVVGNDSFEAFEEMLQIARQQKVDAILHCGDLFHDNKPSRNTLFKTIELLRKYCIGSEECMIEYLSNPRTDFGSSYDSVNFQDPNFNISIPIFAIHGNHDDPTGDGHLSAWNVLAATRLVNYFGRSSEVDDVQASPVLLRKGPNAVALYGIGNIRDERLHRTFLQKKVSFCTPNDNQNSWFNLLLFHQNRIPHGKTNYIPEEFLAPFGINLVVWGHEHECLPYPHYNPLGNFYVVQPGSSVATSLCEGESTEKYALIIGVHNGGFEVEKIKLQSVREFQIRDIVLKDYGLDPLIDGKLLSNFLASKVNEILADIPTSKDCKIPLVRLRVDYTGGFSTINPQCFGQQFIGRIANPKDIIHFIKKKACCPQKHSLDESDVAGQEEQSHISIEEVINEQFKGTSFEILSSNELFEKIRQFVEKDDKDAIERWIEGKLNYFNKSINGTTDPERVKEIIRSQNILNSATSELPTNTYLANSSTKASFTSDEEDMISNTVKTPARRVARPAAKKSTATQTTLKWPSRSGK